MNSRYVGHVTGVFDIIHIWTDGIFWLRWKGITIILWMLKVFLS